MINLKIDPEFQSQIPPLTDDEFKQLEENILKEGKLLSPLIVWGNTLVDGHNRYAILQKHPEIYFSTMPLRFANREEALAWICKNQLGRRNLSPEQKRYLLGKQYESEKKAEKIFHGNQYTLAKKSGGSHDDTHHSGKKTCDRIAEENGVSRASVLRARHYTKGIDIADTLSPGIKKKVFSPTMKCPNSCRAVPTSGRTYSPRSCTRRSRKRWKLLTQNPTPTLRFRCPQPTRNSSRLIKSRTSSCGSTKP